MFSVIVPVYKVEPYLEECVESILNQTYKDFELILVDDGSPDKCPQICDNYGAIDSRVKVIHKPNGGVTSARNLGIQNATGEYLVFVDGDDFIGKELLEKLNDILTQNAVDVVAFGYTHYNDGVSGDVRLNNIAVGCYTGERIRRIYDELLVGTNGNLLNQGAVNHYIWSKCAKKDFFWSIQKQIPKDIIKGEDAALVMLLMSNCTQLYVSDICEYYYRYVPSSASHAFKESMMQSNLILYEFLVQKCIKVPTSNVTLYAMMMLDIELIKAARFYKAYEEFKTYVKKYFYEKIDDILNEPLRWKLPPKSRVKYWILKRRLFVLYWMFYHR